MGTWPPVPVRPPLVGGRRNLLSCSPGCPLKKLAGYSNCYKCDCSKKTTKAKGPFLPGTKLKCGAVVGPICMGYNIKCWGTSLANCKATCKKTVGCKIAEYSTGGTCCTSKYATKAGCPGSFTTSSAWKGYVVCK